MNRRNFMQSLAGVLGAICTVPSLMLGRRRPEQFDHDMKTLDRRVKWKHEPRRPGHIDHPTPMTGVPNGEITATEAHYGIAGEELKRGDLLIFGDNHQLYTYTPDHVSSVIVHFPERSRHGIIGPE